MKKTQFSEQKTAFERAKSSMKSILQIDNLPAEIVQELKKSHDFLSNYDIDIHDTQKKTKLKGKLMTEKEILKMVIEATGYNKWQIEELGEEDSHDEQYLKETYGVEFDKTKEYHVSRSTNSRNDLWLIGVRCMPGHVYITLDTGRVGWFVKGIQKNEDATTALEKEITANF